MNLAKCKAILGETVLIGCKTALFVGCGNLCGHFLNYTVQVIKSSFFKTNFVTPWTGGICCGIFVIVDYLAQALFEKILGQEYAGRPLIVMARIALCIPISAFLCSLEGLVISLDAAAATVICAIACYTIFHEISKRYQQSYSLLAS